MNSERDLILNSVFLKNRVTELGIKQWWLAEQVGVDRKTVIRWIQGKVRSIQAENAKALIEILDCDISELTLSNEADQLASVNDQKNAAQLLMTSSLIEKLGPIGEWNIVEALLKATIVPNLPLNVLGELYNQLTLASWRQSKIDQADVFNKKAEELALRSNDKCILAGALLSKANILFWRGHVSDAISTYQECLKLQPYIELKTLGSILSNLGATLYESGDLKSGEDYQKKAIEVFSENGNPVNLSIAWCHLALIYLADSKLQLAVEACEKSVHFAKSDDYRRGQEMAKLIQAEIHARNALVVEAEALLHSGLEGFSKLGIEEGLNYEFAGRISRILGKTLESKNFLLRGIMLAKDFPLYQAALYFELAKTLMISEEKKEALSSAQKALNLFKKCSAPLKADKVEVLIKSIS